MSLLLDPFSTAFVARALVGGVLVAVICGVVGTWVVIRGMAFFGEAIGHGMLPGVALATVLGFPALAVTLAVAAHFHRAFVAAAFDPRVAQTLGLRPRGAQVALVGLVTLAVVASYQAVGTLLVVALLLAPVVAANRWTRRIPSTMALAAVFGSAAVVIGLLASWHAATAAGSSIAFSAIALAGVSASVHAARQALRATRLSRHRPLVSPVSPVPPAAAEAPAQ